MFTVVFTETDTRTITRKSNAVKVAQRDGAIAVVDESGNVVWGALPVEPTVEEIEAAIEAAAPTATKAKKATERRPYRLTGAVAKADADRSEYVASAFDGKRKYDLTPAEELEIGMTVVGRNKRNPVREIAELTIGKKWVTGYDDNGHVFVYAPIGTNVPVRRDA